MVQRSKQGRPVFNASHHSDFHNFHQDRVTVIPSSIVTKIVTDLQQAFVVHGFDGLYDSNVDSMTGPTRPPL